MTETPWPSEWLRGALGVCVLQVLSEGPTYGYAISTRLDVAGLGAVKGGTLYPLLTRLESAGLVTVQWRPGEAGPGRKYYALSPAGHAELRRRADQWCRFADVTRQLLVGDAGAAPHTLDSTDTTHPHRSTDGAPAPDRKAP